MRKVIVLIALLLLPALSGPANAEQMAIWVFGPDAAHYTNVVTAENVIGTPTLSFSGDDFDTNGKDGIGYLDAAGIMHLSGQSAAWNDVSGTVSDAEWVMTINTIGFQDMAIRWNYLSDATGGNQGPTTFDFSFRVGVGGWVPVLNNQAITRDDNWYVFNYDLSSITVIEGQSSVQFRVDDLDRNDLNGEYMFDNLELTGVPEPCSIALLGIGVLTALTRKRRFA
jgi:hypothetical protein